ncbi:MAG: phycobiliprotein lyase, partial [Moorea sp. SIO3I7]|nr:phycobiliprotein lyase [Moorena sp. SIO3I7]NEO00253.1 phycobiliprotein lyase [Moorena sp. SIO3I7]
MDAMEFFQLSAGNWRSQRTTHHLAFRQAEKGELD